MKTIHCVILAALSAVLVSCGPDPAIENQRRLAQLRSTYDALHRRLETATAKDPLVAAAFADRGSVVLAIRSSLIEELAGFDKMARLDVLRRLGDEAGEHARRELPAALERHATVVFATHVPPMREACWHEGRISDVEWAPHFTCHAVGQTIETILREYPARELTVLCGHTHGNGQFRPLPNVLVLTGGAEYTRPTVQCVFEID